MKTLLVMSPEQILPARYGGAMRSAYLIRGLSKKFKTQAFLHADQRHIAEVLAANPEWRGPDWQGITGHEAYRLSNAWHKIRMRYWNWCDSKARRNWENFGFGWFFGTVCSWKQILHSVSRVYTPDFFMVEHGRNAGIIEYAKILWPRVVCIVNSQNVDSNLMRQNFGNAPQNSAKIRSIERYEKRVMSRADILWACSDVDLEKYHRLGVRSRSARVVPNGVDTLQLPFQRKMPTERSIIFVGTLCYAPNVQGILWFWNEVWPLLKKQAPDVKWKVVGNWPGEEIKALSGPDVEVIGNAPAVRPYLESAMVAICPLLSGSGTRLKILEAFSAGLPMVSTSLGAEGLDVEDGAHLLIRDSAEGFALAVAKLLENPTEREAMRHAARKLVEIKYDWNVISEQASEQMLAVYSEKQSCPTRL